MVASYQAKLQHHQPQAYPITSEFMSRSFVKVSPDTDIYTAMDLLVDHKISGAPVVNDHDELLGFISEKDCLALMTHDAYESNLPGGSVAQYMTQNVRTLKPEAGLNEAADIFMHTPYRKLPVVDQHNQVVGIVRRREVLLEIRAFFCQRMADLRA